MDKNKKIYIFFLELIFVAFYIYASKNMLVENAAGGNFYNKLDNYWNLLWLIPMFIYLFILLSEKGKETFFYYYILLTVLLYGIPLVAYSCSVQTDVIHVIYVNIYIIFLLFIYKNRFLDPHVSVHGFLKKNSKNPWNTYVVCFVIFLATVAIYIYINGFSISLSFASIYTSRSLYKLKSNFIINSLKEALGWFIVPTMILRGLDKKRYGLTVLMIFTEVLLFALGKDKIYFFLIFFAIAFHFVKRITSINLTYICVGGSALIFLIAIIYYIKSGNSILYELVIRRIYVTPQNVANYYFDFFQNNTKLLWRQDVFLIDKIFPDVYDNSYTQLIVNKYLDGIDSNPCTGVIAESYVQFGLFGIIIYGLIMKLYSNIIENITSVYARKEKIFIAICFSYMVIDAAVTSTSFVFDIIFVSIILKFLPSFSKKQSSNNS